MELREPYVGCRTKLLILIAVLLAGDKCLANSVLMICFQFTGEFRR